MSIARAMTEDCIFYDDFTDSVLNESKWVVEGSTNNYVNITDDTFHMNITDAPSGLYTIDPILNIFNSTNGNFTIEMRYAHINETSAEDENFFLYLENPFNCAGAGFMRYNQYANWTVANPEQLLAQIAGNRVFQTVKVYVNNTIGFVADIDGYSFVSSEHYPDNTCNVWLTGYNELYVSYSTYGADETDWHIFDYIKVYRGINSSVCDVEETPELPSISGYSPTYRAGDLASITGDVIGTAGAEFKSLIPLYALAFVFFGAVALYLKARSAFK